MHRILMLMLTVTVHGMQQLYHPQNEIEEFFNELDKPVPVTDVSGIIWKKASLPCDITPNEKDDVVFMVLWFKNAETEPIYSFDIRNRAQNQAKLWSSPAAFGNRAVFRASTKPAKLYIENIQLDDEAVYRCRVDFKNSPTRNVKVNFTVIGRPLPEVRWYLEGKLIDETYQTRSSSLVVNQLRDLKLSREHLNAQLTCVANNTPLANPISKLVLLNINLKPLQVEILHKTRLLSVDREYEIECLASGARPIANITWFLGDKPVERIALKYPNSDNQVISIIKYSPLIEDHGKHLICRADNPAIPDSGIEDRWSLNVQYVPRVSLKIGHNLDARSIKEGDDVYFECDIKANPKAFKQAWFHNKEEIHQNVTAGILITDTSLVLQKVTKYNAGNYTCMATNSEGKGVSNPVTLTIMFAPSCKLRREQLYGALKQETVVLKCEVDSNPKPSAFHWTFNNSGDSSLVSPSRYTHSGFISIINYTPQTDMDYGTLACWAKNSVGHQKRPCIYQVVAAGRPFPLINCSITNQTEDSLQVQCMENFDGGLPQNFLMELLEIPNMESKFNVSVNGRPPLFYLHGIESSASYKVKLFAMNVKGLSDPVYLETSSFKGAAKYTSVTNKLQVINVMAGLISVLFVLTVLLCVFGTFIFFYRCRRKHKRDQEFAPKPSKTDDTIKNQPYMSAVFVRSQQNVVSDSKGPDIITNTFGNRTSSNNTFSTTNSTAVSDQTDECNVVYKNRQNNYEHSNDDVVVPQKILAEPIPDGVGGYKYEINTIKRIPMMGDRCTNKQDTFVIQSSTSNHRPSLEVVTTSTKLQESCI
ncbi:MAM domain-containing glycosylphosphatidylinositol anchor protein 1-like isoform X2 [Planococcus citri]|uniref:MAM domain-containing glycosylphosphatidylinositol anchor protein 1-like isoform X2 n=1 Tax=Planococcus citri TaxID=170843 RepID=UPI0031F731FD